MQLPTFEAPPDSPQQRQADRRRLLRAFSASLGVVVLMIVVFGLQASFDCIGVSLAGAAQPHGRMIVDFVDAQGGNGGRGRRP